MKRHHYLIGLGLIGSLFACQPEQPAQSNSENKGAEISAVAHDYSQKHRPQFHFSPPSQWMNDPNGMYYHDGEYHLFYQHYPDSNVWGPMHWGHAVSTDLVNWENLPIAIYPDELGYIFSGSAVADLKNTSGLGTSENPPMVAIYTYHDMEGDLAGEIEIQSQGIAYSVDKGRTWIKYENNPVLANPGIKDFRDPKVMWHEESSKWIMTLAVWDRVMFYSSPNLIDWTFESEFGEEWGSHVGVWECPDLFPIKVADADEEKWVLLVSLGSGGPNGGSVTQYFVGDFDGNKFELEKEFAKMLITTDAVPSRGELYEDFENGYSKWTAEGSAFGEAPTKGALPEQDELTNYMGEHLSNSFHGGDKNSGTLTSEEFEITKPYMNFLVGGGTAEVFNCLNLLIEGKVVRTTTGKMSDRLDWEHWDVKDLIGKKAKIQIVDNKTNGWGHMLVDQIMFANEPAIPAIERAFWIDYGTDNYAGVTWFNAPTDEQTMVFLGWMNNWQYAQVVPTYDWRSAMTLPRELSLHSDYSIRTRPVDGFESLTQSEQQMDKIDVVASEDFVSVAELNLSPTCYFEFDLDMKESDSFELSLSNSGGEEVKLIVDAESGMLHFDRKKGGISDFHPNFANVHNGEIWNSDEINQLQIFVDRASIEVFINDGKYVFTELVFPLKPYEKLAFKSSSDATVSNLVYRDFKSIWQ